MPVSREGVSGRQLPSPRDKVLDSELITSSMPPALGAYTCQLCSIDPTHGASLVWLNIINSTNVINLPETVEWWNNGTISPGKTVLVDGAKRDRLVCKFSAYLLLLPQVSLKKPARGERGGFMCI